MIVTDAGLDRGRRERRTGPPACGSRSPIRRRRKPWPTRHAVHRPVGRPAARRARREVRRLGLRRARARLLGRPLRRRRGARATPATAPARRELLERHGLGVLGDRQPPRRPGGLRPDRRAPPGRAAAGGLGRRRPRGRAPARRRADEGHRARGRAARRRRRHRLHRLADLAPALLVPAQRLRRDRARLRGVRRALGADHRRLRGRGRALRARGPPDRDRLRLRHHAQGARRRSATAPGFGINFDPSHLEHQFLDSAAFIDRVRRPHLPRPRQGLRCAGSTAARRSSAAT